MNVTEILEELGIPYMYGTWGQKKPPTCSAYAVIDDDVEYDGDDFSVSFAYHSIDIYLYWDGSEGMRKRDQLSNRLICENHKHDLLAPNYDIDTKRYVSIFALKHTIEKGINDGRETY